MSIPAEIDELVKKEFGEKAKLFTQLELQVNDLKGSAYEASKVPGVYVFFHEDRGCLKVGKSQSNASKRAMEHCRTTDNTSSPDKKLQMSQLRHDDKTRLLIYALKEPGSMHWVLALENYLERKLPLGIPAKRNG